jgi:hypothetical protein
MRRPATFGARAPKMEEFHRKFSEPFEMPDDPAILKEQERLISGLNPLRPYFMRGL